MEAGKTPEKKNKVSPIVLAIQDAEHLTTAEIRVHLSRRFWDPDPMKRARKLFTRFGMHNTSARNGILLYVNLRKRRFAIVADDGVHGRVGQQYWDEFVKMLAEDLRSTHPEGAIGLAVRTIGVTMQKYFPAQDGAENPNELPNEVTED